MKFEKVSYCEFEKSMIECFPTMSETEIKEAYANIKLPQRATSGSAGYDFIAPFTITLRQDIPMKFPTGLKCQIDDEYALWLLPRSSLGFKYNVTLENTIGLIDSDYYGNPSNEGHMMCKLTNHRHCGELHIRTGEAYMQGVFLRYGVTDNDSPISTERTGGFGSTNKK